MDSKAMQIDVTAPITCWDGVQRYRIQVGNTLVVKRYNDFKAFDRKLEGYTGKPKLPSAGWWFRLLQKWNMLNCQEARRALLQRYLCRLLDGEQRDLVILKFLHVSEEDLRARDLAELQLYSAAELKAHSFNAVQLRARGRSARALLAAGFRLEELQEAGYKVGSWTAC